MLAAIAGLRQLEAARIVAAAPVIAGSIYQRIRQAADDVAAVIVPEEFYCIGEWYEDFSMITDDEVCQLLAEAKKVERLAPTPAQALNTAGPLV
jgi:putative phosphoribosyl transferase